MTFADSILHLVRVGARIEPVADPVTVNSSQAALAEPLVELEGLEDLDAEMAEPTAPASGDQHQLEPGLADLEAAVALVSAGLATRVVLAGFTSWPGLLWRAYRLADAANVLILPTVVRPGGKVDVVITRDSAAHG